MPQLSQRQALIIIIAAGVILALAVFIYLNVRGSSLSNQKVTLHVWGYAPQKIMSGFLTGYHQAHSNVTVDYTEVPKNNYRDKILSAIAAGQGPDIFMVGNRDVPLYQNILSPATTEFTPVQFQNTFPQVASDDLISGGQIYAMPLYLDSLAMIYNKDLINSAGIATLPATWDALDAEIPVLRAQNSDGSLLRSAVALGGTEQTIDNGVDALFLLMLQNGTQMVDATHAFAAFGSQASNGTPGLTAFNYYLQFGNRNSSLYSWDETARQSSLDAFAAGKVAILFDYKHALDAITAKSPFLHVGVALMPQAAGATTRTDYASYDGLAVAKASANAAWAWDFVIYAATDPTANGAYLSGTGEPSAVRTVIATEESDPTLAVFAQQALTAKSWYEVDDIKIHTIMNQVISAVLSGQTDAGTALGQAQTQVTQLMTQK